MATAAYTTRHLSQETAPVFVSHLRPVPACVTAADSRYVCNTKTSCERTHPTGAVGSQRVLMNSQRAMQRKCKMTDWLLLCSLR